MSRIIDDRARAEEAYIPVSDRTRPAWERLLSMSAEEYEETVLRAALEVLTKEQPPTTDDRT